jgi:hypothetical protein
MGLKDASRPEPLQSPLSRTRKDFVWFDLGGAGHAARMAVPAGHGVNVVLAGLREEAGIHLLHVKTAVRDGRVAA